MAIEFLGIGANIEEIIKDKDEIEISEKKGRKGLKELNLISKEIMQERRIIDYLRKEMPKSSGILLGISSYEDLETIHIPYGITVDNGGKEVLTYCFEVFDGFYTRPYFKEKDRNEKNMIHPQKNSAYNILFFSQQSENCFPHIYKEQDFPSPREYMNSIDIKLNKKYPPIVDFNEAYSLEEIKRKNDQ